MEDKNLLEVKKMIYETNRDLILWFSGRFSDLRSQIAKN